MWTSLKRVAKTGYNNFFRSIGLNTATVFVMVIVICFINFLFIFNIISKILIADVKEKVDISIYFKEDSPTEEILSVKSALSGIPEVKNIDFITKEQALDNFIERHKGDPVIMESLAEVGSNPFLASLSVRAKEGFQYEKITNFLEAVAYKNLIERVDYFQRKPIIDKVFSVTSGINKGGLILSIILGLIAVLIAFNTVRIAIYNSHEEISVMRLVGASNWFIRGPFIIQGLIAGLFSAVISLVIVLVICYGLNSPVSSLSGISLFNLFASNFWILVLIQVVSGMGIGILSSVFAIRKYLKV